MYIKDLQPGMILQVDPSNPKNKYGYDCFMFQEGRETIFTPSGFKEEGETVLLATPGRADAPRYTGFYPTKPGPSFGVYLGHKQGKRMVYGYFKHHYLMLGDQLAIVFGHDFRYIEPMEEK